MLERLEGFAHERAFLSARRTPASALASLPRSWPQLAARARGSDLIHTHGDVASVLALPMLRSRPSVMTTHGLHMLRRVRGPRRALMIRGLAAAASACDVVICTSAAERDELVEVVREADRNKLRVIHNGIDPPVLMEESERAAVRRALGVGPETVLGLFVGRLEPRKAPLLAALAAARVRAAGAPFVLAVAGDGPEIAPLRATSSDAVQLLGHRPDLDRLLCAVDVFVQPSEREGMSLALLEAMGHGLAVVAADGPGNPEAVADTGILFAAGDEDGLVAALGRVIAEPQLRASLGAAARRRALEEFGVGRFLADTQSVYREVIGLTAPDRGDAGARA